MSVGDKWIKLECGYPRNRKIRAMVQRNGADGILARDMYVQLVLYCRAEETDGVVPDYETPLLMHPLPSEDVKHLLKLLLDAGLITSSSDGSGETVFNVVGYVERNGTKAQHVAEHLAHVENGRTGGKARVSAATSPDQAQAKQPLKPNPVLASSREEKRRGESLPPNGASSPSARVSENAWADLGGGAPAPASAGAGPVAPNASPARRHPSSQTVGQALAVGRGTPATDEQRTGHLASIRASLNLPGRQPSPPEPQPGTDEREPPF